MYLPYIEFCVQKPKNESLGIFAGNPRQIFLKIFLRGLKRGKFDTPPINLRKGNSHIELREIFVKNPCRILIRFYLEIYAM